MMIEQNTNYAYKLKHIYDLLIQELQPCKN